MLHMTKLMRIAGTEPCQTPFLGAHSACEMHEIILVELTKSFSSALMACAPAERLFCTIGVHPTRCKEIEESPQGPEAYWDALRVLLKNNAGKGKIVAIGECGLDYDRCPIFFSL